MLRKSKSPSCSPVVLCVLRQLMFRHVWQEVGRAAAQGVKGCVQGGRARPGGMVRQGFEELQACLFSVCVCVCVCLCVRACLCV